MRRNGSALGKVIVVLAVAALIVTTSAADADAAERRSGARADEPSVFVKVAVLLINFTNQPSVPWAKEDVNQLFFGDGRSVARYYDELSEGQMSVTGQVFGYLKAGARDGDCDYGAWGRTARSSATASGIDLSQFTNVVHVFPYQPACYWNGFARAGSNGGPGRYTWVNGLLTLFVGAHELGHNFGLGHAGFTNCKLDGQRVSIGGTCTTYEYGDPFDIMGYGGDRHVHTLHRLRLGFLPATDVQTVTSDGAYEISAAEYGGEHPRLIKIPRPNGSFYFLEYRRPFGQFDDFGDNAAVVGGVTIRIATGNGSSTTRLVDTTAQTCTFNDATLAQGETFLDPNNRIEITTLDTAPDSARVQIRMAVAATTSLAGEGESTDNPDGDPPTAVSNIAAQQVTGRSVAVTWAKATDNVRVVSYEVYADGVLKGRTCDLRFRNVPLSDGRPHQLSVRAIDAAGNLGPMESTTYTPPDFTSPVMGLRIYTFVSGGKVTVSWRAATDNVGVAFYRVIKNGRILADVGASVRSYRDDSPGTGYLRYSVTAFDAARNASRPVARKIYR